MEDTNPKKPTETIEGIDYNNILPTKEEIESFFNEKHYE